MITPEIYRAAMSRLGAAVNIITSRGPGGLSGATACAVCSVTDAPPTLLVCLNRANRSNAVVKANGVLCVNVLAAHQEDLSVRFSSQTGASIEERYEATAWEALSTGAPVLNDSVASFDCEVTQTVEVGTHSVFFARVVELRVNDSHHGLIYFGRRYLQVGHLGL